MVVACLVALTGLVAAGGALAAEKKYVNGIDANFPPFAFVDKSGKPSGFDVEALDWIAQKKGFKVTHQPWTGTASSPASTPEDRHHRQRHDHLQGAPEKGQLHQPLLDHQQVWWRPKDSSLTVEQAMKSGKAVGVQRGTTEAKWFEQQKGRTASLTVKVYDSAPLAGRTCWPGG